VLLVSHDRAFLNNVVGSVLAFEDDTLREYVGGYDDWVRQRRANGARDAASTKGETPASTAKPEASPPTAAATSPAKAKKLSYKDQRELELLPGKIESLEAKIAAIHEEMAQPGFFKQDGATLAAKQAEERSSAAELSAAYARWEELEQLSG